MIPELLMMDTNTFIGDIPQIANHNFDSVKKFVLSFYSEPSTKDGKSVPTITIPSLKTNNTQSSHTTSSFVDCDTLRVSKNLIYDGDITSRISYIVTGTGNAINDVAIDPISARMEFKRDISLATSTELDDVDSKFDIETSYPIQTPMQLRYVVVQNEVELEAQPITPGRLYVVLSTKLTYLDNLGPDNTVARIPISGSPSIEIQITTSSTRPQTIIHNFDKYPSARIITSDGSEHICSVVHKNKNEMDVNWIGDIEGFIYVN